MKGFLHFDYIQRIMPHTVRGAHAFRPSQQTHGAITNTAFIGVDNSALVANTSSGTAAAAGAMGPPPLHTNNGPDSSDDELGIPPMTPMCPSSTVSSVTTSKHRHSVLGDEASSTIYSKQSRNSSTGGVAALHGIKDMMLDIGMSMRDGLLGQPCHHRRSSAEHRIEVTALL